MKEGYTFDEVSEMSPLQFAFCLANKLYWSEQEDKAMKRAKRKGRRGRA